MKVGARIVRAFMRLLSLQPLKLHYFWSKCFAFVLNKIMRYRRDVVMINLSRSFPEKKYWEIKEIAEKFYRHFGRIFVEAVWFAGSWNNKRLEDSEICRYSNLEVLDGLLTDTPGVILLTSHMGNWELLGGCAHYRNAAGEFPKSFDESTIAIVYKALSSKLWDRVMLENRCAPAKVPIESGCVESKNIMRFVIRNKDKKNLYVFPTDQCPYAYAGNHVVDDFLHQSTTTMTGGAALAKKLGMAVCYMTMKEREEGGYDFCFEEICRDASQYSPEEIMNKFYSLLEKDIQEQPWNYLWTHKRWKR